jgi:predicted nucleotide-binding protein
VRLTDAQVGELGEKFPQIWRSLARELAHRVEQRNTVASTVDEKIRVFIMAPSDGNEIARAIEQDFAEQAFKVVIWKEGTFRGAKYSVESLEHMLDQSDVAVVVTERGESSHDSIIFELGFFMGRLGRHRTFLIEPRREEIELPRELAGINVIPYKDAPGKDLKEVLAPACTKLKRHILELGPNRLGRDEKHARLKFVSALCLLNSSIHFVHAGTFANNRVAARTLHPCANAPDDSRTNALRCTRRRARPTCGNGR